jgi:regulatory protein
LHVTFRPKEGDKERWEILLDGEKWREVHRAIFGRKPSFSSSPSSEEELQRIFDAFEYRRVKGYVLWRLSTQSYHSEQLAKLLRDRLVQSKTIDRVLQEYREMGFLDDDSWLQSFMRSQQKRYSLRFILSKLHHKGLSSETLQRLAKEWKNPEEELQAIQHLLKTKYRSKNLIQYKERQKVIAALVRKGYTFDQVQAAFQQINSN